MMKSIQKHRMTILEVLVAMAILVIIMTFLASMVYSVSQISRRQQMQSDLFRDQRQLLSVLSMDLNAMVVRPNVDEEITCNFDMSSETVTGFTKSSVEARFITHSGLGVHGTDTSTLQEVSYYLCDSELYRFYSRSSDPTAWNFYTDTEASVWYSTYSDSALVASSVDTFYMEAYGSTGALVTGDLVDMPSYIVATVKLLDEADNSKREFKKKIFINRGN